MTARLPQPVPKDLREQLVDLILSAPEEQLPEINRVLLIAERDRLWLECQKEAQADFDAGKYDNVQEMVLKYRSRNK